MQNYTVTASDPSKEAPNGYIAERLLKNKAIQTAKEWAKEYPELCVLVSWYRASDGQHGYLNPDGNHSITGVQW